MNKQLLTDMVKAKALELGFYGISFAKAEFMDKEAQQLEQWLNQSYHGDMHYMEQHFDLRVDPTKLVPGAKSVISLMYNYFTENVQSEDSSYKISMYAHGKDYHTVVKDKMNLLFDFIKSIKGEVEGRCFVDSAPILERDWAKRSGLGWVGKNTLLISPKKGSYFFLGEIILDLDFLYDPPIKDYCGTCTKCIDSCPTDAISPNGYILDSKRCISYLTIELKTAIPEEFQDKMENYIFGCDICQQVCPWNRFSSPHHEKDFTINEELKNMSTLDWEQLTQETFSKVFKNSAIKRTKFSGLQRNINFVKKSQ
jgi:epoxyqueuosine reductase